MNLKRSPFSIIDKDKREMDYIKDIYKKKIQSEIESYKDLEGEDDRARREKKHLDTQPHAPTLARPLCFAQLEGGHERAGECLLLRNASDAIHRAEVAGYTELEAYRLSVE